MSFVRLLLLVSLMLNMGYAKFSSNQRNTLNTADILPQKTWEIAPNIISYGINRSMMVRFFSIPAIIPYAPYGGNIHADLFYKLGLPKPLKMGKIRFGGSIGYNYLSKSLSGFGSSNIGFDIGSRKEHSFTLGFSISVLGKQFNFGSLLNYNYYFRNGNLFYLGSGIGPGGFGLDIGPLLYPSYAYTGFTFSLPNNIYLGVVIDVYRTVFEFDPRGVPYIFWRF